MGYHHLSVADVEPTPDRPSVQRSLSGAAGLEHLGAHVYEVAPGEAIPLAYHYHEEQEEVFYVLEGTLHVETPAGDFAVSADEVFVVEPDSPQRAHVPEDASEGARAFVVGAPSKRDVHRYEPE